MCSTLRKNLADIIYVAVPALFLLVFVGVPLLNNIVLSFQKVDPLQLGSLFQIFRPWNHFQNYRAVISDPSFLQILQNTLVFLFSSVFFQLGIGLLLAILFSQLSGPTSSFRGLFLIPWIMPQLAVGAIWNWIFSANIGLLNFLLRQMNIIEQNIFWLSDIKLSLWSIIIVNIWLGIPFNMLMLSAALADIPHSLYEAAKIDGAGPIARFFKIALPLLKNAIVSVFTLGCIFTLQQFDLFIVLTGGGPSNSSNVLQLWGWQKSFSEFEFGQGAALSVIILSITLICSALYASTSGRREKYNA